VTERRMGDVDEDTLDSAWAAVEKALRELPDPDWGFSLYSETRFGASAFATNARPRKRGSQMIRVEAATPIAALLALVDKLRELRGSASGATGRYSEQREVLAILDAEAARET
jgi:hypothetical protein